MDYKQINNKTLDYLLSLTKGSHLGRKKKKEENLSRISQSMCGNGRYKNPLHTVLQGEGCQDRKVIQNKAVWRYEMERIKTQKCIMLHGRH